MESIAMAGVRLQAETFDVEKAIAAVAHLVEKTGASMYPVMKMLYLADKMHLERYGRFISGDSYAAMEQGPVPSRTYNMVKHVRGGELRCAEDAKALQFFDYHLDTHQIIVRERPDPDELSDSDIECLDEICQIYQRAGKWAVRDMSHDDAWRKVWGSFVRRMSQRKSVPMPLEKIVAELDDAESLIAYLRDPHPGEAEASTPIA